MSNITTKTSTTRELEQKYWETVERPQETRSTFLVEMIEFSAGRELYALDIRASRGITRYPRMVQIPGAPKVILGAMTFRGRVIPVADFRRLMGLSPVAWSDEFRIVVIGEGDEILGLAVDELVGITEMDLLDIQPPPSSFKGTRKEIIRGQIQRGKDLVILLDVGVLLTVLACGSEEVASEI